MQKCNSCGRRKPLSEFPRRRLVGGGWQVRKRCKRCVLDYQARHYRSSSKRRSDIYRANKGYTAKLRIKVREYLLAHPCVDCGEANPVCLDFDHRDRMNKVLAVSTMIMRAWSEKRIFGEIAKCDIRCANCHRKRTAKEFNWHSARTAPPSSTG